MWLPSPIYERVPQCWFLIGILLITDGAYLGPEYKFWIAYIVAGLVCCIHGMGIAVVRLAYRHKQLEGPEADADADAELAPVPE